MRYEDSSQAGAVSNQSDGQGPEARDDLDTLAAGARGPATGNVISGEGTQYGAASSDLSADDAQVTAVAGAGGQDSSFSGGKLAVTGEFGKLSIDAEGNYSYLANQGAPENSRDRFTYTLADKQGNSDTAALTIEIGKTPVVIQANAQQVVVGPDGVVILPAGVQLSDIHVVGRNLVVNLPDGTQMVIIDGAVFVPQLVLGTVEVPATNLAALLIDSEPRPAAGTPPPSGGGNFGLPPGPLDPGVPLGDLLPPTEMTYTPPEVREVNGILDRRPEISIDPGNGVPVANAVDSVSEAGLPTGVLPNRNTGEPAGSGEIADGNGSNNSDQSEVTTGTIVYNSPDDPNTVSIDGLGAGGPLVFNVNDVTFIGQTIAGQYGTLTITSIAPGAIGYSYRLNDNTSGKSTSDPFTVVITDSDGDTDTATLTVNIVDDEPTARPDTDSIAAGQFGPATGNVITDAAAGDVGDSDTNAADTVGADNARVSFIDHTNAAPGATVPVGGFADIAGQYGTLRIFSGGDYTYTRNPGTPGGVNDVFNYTLTDGDGDAKVTTLTISIGDATPITTPNPTALVDDDAVPLANGNPGGVGDDADAANLSGTLGASGGDGPLTYDLLLTGAPAGFSYVDGPNGSVLVQQGGTTVLTITVNATTGAYTVTQNAPIDHVALLDENNVAFTINYRVTDQDGDPADGTLNINVDDDTPTIGRADVSLPTLTVDETNLALNATGGVAALFQTSFGADGAGSVSYALTVVNGTDSGLVDVGTGLPVLLYNIGGVVTGSTSATLAGVTAGNTVFTASINANTGVVTLDQVRALDHPSNPNPNDPVSPTATSIQAVATVTDGDGDPVSLAVNIGSSLVFLDDGPSVDITLSATAEPTLLTQDTETDGTPTTQDSASASFAANFTVTPNFGADGPGTQAVTYALGVSAAGVDSGLNQGGADIFLHLIGGVVVGSTSASAAGVNAGNTVFNVTVDAAGSVTLTQFSQIDHPIAGDPTATGSPFADHVLALTDTLVTLTATANVTDGDGDPASDSQVLNIGANLQFADDGPDISAALTGTLLKLDETDGVGVPGEVDPAGGNLGTITVAAASLFTVSNVNISADTPTTLGYALVLSADGVASGLLVSSNNAPIFLYNIGGTITGSTSATLAGVNAGNTAFTVSVNSGTGAVTMTQFLAVEHSNTASNDEDSSGLTAGVLSIRVTATDFDGDTDQASADLGSIIRFEDDGPTMNRADASLPTLTVDETNLAINATGNVSVVFAGAYGSDGPGTTSYAVSTVNGTDSGLVDVATSLPVLLYNIGGVVVGSTSATLGGVNAGNTVFTVSIDANTGVVTLDQIRALDHPANPNPNDPVSPNATSIQAVATITDSDGDPVSLAVNIGASLVFLDDGPSVDISLSATAEPTLLTQDTETDGTPTTQDSASASFAANFTVTPNFGADGPGTQAVIYALGVSAAGADSGLDQGGASIFLHLIGGVVVGSTSATLAGVNAGNTVFNVSVDAAGTVTLTQFSQIDHPAGGDPSPTGSPFPDHLATLADSLVTLTATANVTDGDGDPASDSQVLNIGAQLQFADDGPDISAVLTGNQIRIDETDGVVAAGGEVDPVGGNLGTVTVSAATLFTVSNVNLSADTPTTLSYALVLSGQGVASGLLLSTTNAPIFLYNIGGVVTGSTSATLAGVNAGNTAFTATINPGTGAVTLTQFLAVEHSNPANHDEDSSGLTNGVLSVQVTATDFDGDTDQASVDLGSIVRFEDDGPAVDVTVNGQLAEPALVTQDAETDGVPTAEDTASASFAANFTVTPTPGVDGQASLVTTYALGVSAPGVDSGLDSSGSSIFLYNIGGVVVGSTSATLAGVNAGNTVFNVSVVASGVGAGTVTLTQFAQIDHITVDPTPTGAPFTDHVATLTDSLVTLTATSTITDNDGDTATDSQVLNIGAQLQFQDDGPDVAAVLTGTLLKLDETDGVGVPGEVDPAGGNLGTITVAAATLVSITQPNVSADTPTTLAYSLVLSADGVASGLLVSSNNAPIFLYNIGGTITGSTSATLAGVNAGNTAFTVSVNSGTGAVTMTQFLAVEHTNTASNDEDSSGLAAGALSLRVTATDFDGDTDQASVDLGSAIRFEDDGPSATNDVDSVFGGVGPATGNVLTGVEVAVAEDGNATDGVADNVGSDSPGRITFIDHSNPAPGAAVPNGGSVAIAGTYGVLTIFSNGDYSYLRNEGTPGGVSDVFTYTLTDADGDSVTATLTIGIDDNFPLAGDRNVQLDDETLTGGIAGGTGDDNVSGTTGTLPGSGGDGALTWSLLATGAPLGFSYALQPDGSIFVSQGGTHVVTIAITNTATGAYTVTQVAPIDHPDGLNENNVQFTVNYRVTDADGDFADGTIDVDVDDDTPTINVTQTNEASVLLTTQDAETDGVPTNEDTAVSTANFSGVFGLSQAAGADGAAAATLSYALAVTNAVSGLNSHGVAINLYLIGGVVVGSTAANAGAVNAGNTIFNIAVSGTGVVTLTQFQQVDHPIAGDPTATGTPFDDHIISLVNGKVTLTASSTITDGDNDTATDQEVVDLGGNIRFADDGPIAANDTVGQTTENQPVTFGVFGNDQFGADGVDTDNNPTVNVTFTQPPVGQGTVSYNAVTGEFTFTPAAGQEGSTQFTYTIIDFDGDTSTATVTINLQPDSVPVAADGVAKVDDDGLPAGVGDNASGDLDANLGEAPVVNTSEAVWHGQLVATSGGDTIANYTFASMHNTGGSVGTETVNYTWVNGTSTLTATTVGGTRPGTILFNVVVNQATGSYNLTLVNNILHADEVANQENDATTNLTFTVTDSDGDSDTGLVVVTFDDDMPVITSVTDPLSIANTGTTPSGTGNFAFDIGADENSDFDDISVAGFTVSVNNVAATNVLLVPGAETATTASYSFSFTYPTGSGTTANATGTLVFNKAAGTYTVTLTSGPIQGFSILQTASGSLFQGYEFGTSNLDGSQPEISVTQIQGTPGTPLASDLFVQFTSVSEPSSGTGDNNLEVNTWVPGVDNPPPVDGGGDTSWSAGQLFNQDDGWVSTSGSANGTNGDTIQGGEVLDFTLVQGANPTGILAQPATFGQATTMFLKFDGIGTGEDMIVILKLYDPNTNTYTTRAVMIQNTDIQKGPGSGPGVFSGITLDQNDGLVIIESNDYNAPGENWVIVGAQIAGSDEGVTGTAIDLNSAIGAGGDSDVDNNGSLDTQSFATDVNDGPFKISSIGFLTQATTTQSATIEFDVTIEDSDGDQVIQQDVTVNIGTPVAPLAAASTLQSNDTQKHGPAANNNTGITAGALAAAGVASTSAAAETTDGGDTSVTTASSTMEVERVAVEADSGGSPVGGSADSLATETEQSATDLSSNGANGDQSNGQANTLDTADAKTNGQEVREAANDDQGPANDAVASLVAPNVAMPSAAALAAAGLTGEAGHGGSVEQVLADALGGHGAAPTVDGLLQAVLGHGNSGNAEFGSLASPIADHVPAWDMGANGAFVPGADMMFRMDVAMLHHDAVQPVVNG